MKELRLLGTVSAVLVFLSGCASVDLDPASIRAPQQIKRPSIIYVKPFDIDKGQWLAFANKPPEEFKKFEQAGLQRHMLEVLREVAPTAAAPAVLPDEGFLVTGEFVEVDPGHGAARYFVGFGVGEHIGVTDVRIFDLAKSKTAPIISFRAEGGSEWEGGIIGAIDGLDADWHRTARETRDFLLARIEGKPIQEPAAKPAARKRIDNSSTTK